MFLFYFFIHAKSKFNNKHAVSLSITAPWSSGTQFSQIFAFCVRYSFDYGYKFLKKCVNNITEIDDKEFLYETAKGILSKDVFNILKANIDLGSLTPKAIFNGNDVEECERIANEHGMKLYETDLVKGNPRKINCVNVKKDYKFISQLLEENKDYALRLVDDKKEEMSKVRGYGIELRPFKYSMEYGTKDNKDNENDTSENINISDETLGNIPKSIEEDISSLELNYFDLKFAEYLQNVNQSLPKIMRDISNNWPLFMKEISKQNISSKNSLQNIRYIIGEDATFSNLNGRVLDFNDIDIFTFMDILDQETILNQLLRNNLNMDIFNIQKFTTTNPPKRSNCFLNFGSHFVEYYNDIENDDYYSDWDSDINQIYNIRKAIPRIKKNLLNLILYVDLSTTKGLSHLSLIIHLVRRGYPVRVGIVPYFNMKNSISRKIAFAFHTLGQNVGYKAGIDFLLECFQNSEFDNFKKQIKIIDENVISKTYNGFANHFKLRKWNKLNELYNPSSSEYRRIKNTHSYLQKIGIRIGSISINGRLYKAFNYIQEYLEELYKGFELISNMYSNLRIYENAKEPIINTIKKFFVVLDKIDYEIFYNDVKSLEIYNLPISQQIQFLDELNNSFTEVSNSFSYLLVYCNEKETDLTIIKQFAIEKGYNLAINPNISHINISKEENVLIINGRILYNFNFTNMEKLNYLDIYNKKFIVDYIVKYASSKVLGFYLCTILNDWEMNKISRENIDDSIFNMKNSLIYCGDKSEINWYLLIDPFTKEYQKFSSFLNYLSENNILNLKMILNPSSDIQKDLTIFSTYYRSSIDSDSLLFTCLNDTTTYSSMIDIPNSWQVESFKASFDLDNILLNELTPKVHYGEYILTNIIIEGDCYSNKMNSVKGTKLRVTPYKNGTSFFEKSYVIPSETFVMKEHGYFQLMGAVGINKVELDDKNIYYQPFKKYIEVNTYAIRRHHLVLKESGKIAKKPINYHSNNSSRVDIFAVTSGHLYERLLKIMMISARKQTNSSVTYWILNNFLSPQFKAVLPILSNKYNFNYQLVKYKWPYWLNKQVEKQRVIWGNKILFLDVLFPPDLDRVIYVDSDQIVRTDMNELMTMDFKGAPYAFTPFCDSRIETEPYRFWHHGFWADHLRGMKYYISALFAIDLQRFRQLHGGDILRKYYQFLSRDKNSLANLDQDLPNFAQPVLPIYSLPQNWLWCETWCSDDTIEKAKTIDLCNNPLTKIPKLRIAETRVPEWPGLDKEARSINVDDDAFEKMLFYPQ